MGFFKFGLSRELSLLESVGGDFPVRKIGAGCVHATHMKRFAFFGDEAAPDDQFG